VYLVDNPNQAYDAMRKLRASMQVKSVVTGCCVFLRCTKAL